LYCCRAVSLRRQGKAETMQLKRERGRPARRFRPLAENIAPPVARTVQSGVCSSRPVGETPTGATGTVALPISSAVNWSLVFCLSQSGRGSNGARHRLERAAFGVRQFTGAFPSKASLPRASKCIGLATTGRKRFALFARRNELAQHQNTGAVAAPGNGLEPRACQPGNRERH